MNIRLALFSLFLSFAVHVGAADFACPQFFWEGKVPVVDNEKEMRARPLCFTEFAVLHSGQSKTPLYVVERLNKNTLVQARSLQRGDKFFSDARLPRAERGELSDYRSSGYDRGHMAPAGDMTTPEGMAQSFSLANMVPQCPVNNRKSWASIEKATRKYVMRASGDVYVISGPVFNSNPTAIGANSIWVPNYFFKLVFDPSRNKAWAHWIENQDNAKINKPISYEELVARTGIEFLPGFRPIGSNGTENAVKL